MRSRACHKDMIDWSATEKSTPQHLCGSGMAFCEMALGESVNQGSQYRDILRSSASQGEVAHRPMLSPFAIESWMHPIHRGG